MKQYGAIHISIYINNPVLKNNKRVSSGACLTSDLIFSALKNSKENKKKCYKLEK